MGHKLDLPAGFFFISDYHQSDPHSQSHWHAHKYTHKKKKNFQKRILPTCGAVLRLTPKEIRPPTPPGTLVQKWYGIHNCISPGVFGMETDSFLWKDERLLLIRDWHFKKLCSKRAKKIRSQKVLQCALSFYTNARDCLPQRILIMLRLHFLCVLMIVSVACDTRASEWSVGLRCSPSTYGYASCISKPPQGIITILKQWESRFSHSASTERPRTELWTTFVIRLLSALGFSDRKPPQAWKVLKDKSQKRSYFLPRGVRVVWMILIMWPS